MEQLMLPQQEYQKQWYQQNREKKLEQSRANYQSHKDRRLAQMEARYWNEHERVLQIQQTSYAKYRDKVLNRTALYYRAHPEAYAKMRQGYQIRSMRRREALFHILGHVCTMCGEHDKVVLQFDHVNGGGNAEYKAFKHTSAMHKYYIEHPEEAKQKLQVLCANCNRRKVVFNDEAYSSKWHITKRQLLVKAVT